MSWFAGLRNGSGNQRFFCCPQRLVALFWWSFWRFRRGLVRWKNFKVSFHRRPHLFHRFQRDDPEIPGSSDYGGLEGRWVHVTDDRGGFRCNTAPFAAHVAPHGKARFCSSVLLELRLVESNSITFSGRTIALRDAAVVDCLIKRVQLTPAVDHSLALDCPRLRAWTQLTYFLSFSISSVVPLHFTMNKISFFAQCPKDQGSVNNFRMTLVCTLRALFPWFVSCATLKTPSELLINPPKRAPLRLIVLKIKKCRVTLIKKKKEHGRSQA